MKLFGREPVELDKGGRKFFNYGKDFPYYITGKNIFYSVKDCFFINALIFQDLCDINNFHVSHFYFKDFQSFASSVVKELSTPNGLSNLTIEINILVS